MVKAAQFPRCKLSGHPRGRMSRLLKINKSNREQFMAKKLGTTDRKPTHEEIAERARAIYAQNGGVPGHDLDNWLAAESQLRYERNVTADPRPVTQALVRTTTASARA